MSEALRFSARIRRWRPDATAGLAVIDIPPPSVAALGGLKQLRVQGTLNGSDFVSSTMPAGGGRLAMSVSKAMMAAANVQVGDEVSVTVRRA